MDFNSKYKSSEIEEILDSVGGKQDALVSGTSIKTINGNSLLGSGDVVISGSDIKKFIFTTGFTFDEDSWEEYQKADEFYYYHEIDNIYIKLYKTPSTVGEIYLSGGTVYFDELITVSVVFSEDGSNYHGSVDDLNVGSIVDDALVDAGVGSPLEYVILEPIYDGMVLENLMFAPFETKQLQLISQFDDEEHLYNLYKAHISTNTESLSVSLYGYYNNNAIICVTEDLATFTCVLNLIPIGGEGGEGGYDDTEIKGQISEIKGQISEIEGQISEIEATIGDINTILESIING